MKVLAKGAPPMSAKVAAPAAAAKSGDWGAQKQGAKEVAAAVKQEAKGWGAKK